MGLVRSNLSRPLHVAVVDRCSYGVALLTSLRSLDVPASPLEAHFVDHPVDEPVVVLAVDELEAETAEFVREIRGARHDRHVIVLFRIARTEDIAASIRAGAIEVRPFARDDLAALARTLRFAAARIGVIESAIEDLHSDPVTGLLNRRGLFESLQKTCAVADSEAPPRALLYMDLDRFKAVNDTFGHSAGDRVLAHTARQVEAAVAECEVTSARIARVGGDEFVVAFSHPSAGERARAVAARIRSRLARPPQIDGNHPPVTPSIGIAVGMANDTIEDWMARADLALYRAKSSGRNRIEEFDHSMALWTETSEQYAEDLRAALEGNGLELVASATEWIGARTLDALMVVARMKDRHGPSGASLQFIADQAGLGVQFGQWTLRAAVRVAAENDSAVVVRFASCLFALPNAVDVLAADLAAARVDPTRIRLLISEHQLLDEDLTGAVIERLRALGVRLVVDSFGSKSGSITALARWRMDAVLLDTSLISGVSASPQRTALLNAVVATAHSLGYFVIAPWVSDAAERAAIDAAGCDQAVVAYVPEPPNRLRRRRHPTITLDPPVTTR